MAGGDQSGQTLQTKGGKHKYHSKHHARVSSHKEEKALRNAGYNYSITYWVIRASAYN